jgi:hypothetical protein
MSMKFPPEQELDAVAKGVLEAAYTTALEFLRERMEEAVHARHISRSEADKFVEIIQRELASIIEISAYVPLSKRADIANALGTLVPVHVIRGITKNTERRTPKKCDNREPKRGNTINKGK